MSKKRINKTVSFLLMLVMGALAGPTINSADLVVVARNTDLDDQFALVALSDIPGNSVIFLTDEGWDDFDFTFDGTEDVFAWTVSASGITAGTILRFTNQSTVALELLNGGYGTLSQPNGTADMNLAAGDQLFIYQTDDNLFNGTIQRLDGNGSAEAGMVYAFNGDNSTPSTYGWLNAGMSHTSSTSHLPDNMTALTTYDGSGNANIANANGMLTQASLKDSSTGEYDNYKYDGPTTSATKEDWLIRIHTTANWLASDIDSMPLYTGSLSSDLTVIPPNASPTIVVSSTTLSYTENDAATQIDATATTSDADGDADWNGGRLTAQITANSEFPDMVTIPDNVVGSINTSGTSLRNGATVIGTLNVSEGTVTNGTMLIITFNGNATNVLVQQTLRALSYQSMSDDPGTLNRTVTLTVTDTNSDSASDTRTISVAKADNDVPTLVSNTGLRLNEGATAAIPLDSLESDDTDSDNSTLTYTITSATSNGQLENTDNVGVSISSFTQQNLIDGKVQYVHDGSNTTSDVFTFTISDGLNTLTNQTFSITVNPIDDDTPTLTTNNGLTLNEGATKALPLDSLESDDTDTDNSTLTYTITSATSNGQLENTDNAGVSIASFTQQNLIDGKIQYVHDGSQTVSDVFTFTISDGSANKLTGQTFTIVISTTNDTPTIVDTLEDPTFEEDFTEQVYPFALTELFTDEENGSALIYSAQSLTGNVVVTVRNDSAVANSTLNWFGIDTVVITAEDSSGLTVSDTMLFEVTSVNDVPTLNSSVTSKTITFGDFFDDLMDASDVDVDDSLIYSLDMVTGTVPADIDIDHNGTISWTPSVTDNGTYDFIAIATDDSGATVKDTFEVVVDIISAIDVIDTKEKTTRFLAYPNPVRQSSQEVTLVFPEGFVGTGECRIYDVVGALIDQQEITVVTQGLRLRWDLRNESGQKVRSGSYVAIVQLKDPSGRVSVMRTMIGVQE